MFGLPAWSGEKASDLTVSKVAWRRLAYPALLISSAWSGGGYLLEHGLTINADGLVFRERVVAAAPFDARIKEVFVRPGDRVQAGDQIARLESASIGRTLAELSAETARVSTRIAQLKAREAVISSLLPLAEQNAGQTRSFVDRVAADGRDKAASTRYLLELAAASFTANERVASLSSERISLAEELQQNAAALAEVGAAYSKLKLMYNDGVLLAPAGGIVGSSVAAEGTVLTSGGSVCEIFNGEPYVLAYLPENGLAGAREGQDVLVRSGGQTVRAKIGKILPFADALPPEFQKPVKARDQGQVARIVFKKTHLSFPVQQKVRVSTCLADNCGSIANAALDSATKVAHAFTSMLAMGR